MDGIIYTRLCQACVLEACGTSRDRVYVPMEKNMPYWSAYVSHMEHIGAICACVGMSGLWGSPNQDGADVFY